MGYWENVEESEVEKKERMEKEKLTNWILRKLKK